MNVFAKFDEIPSMILQDIKETKRYGNTVGGSFGQTFGRTDNVKTVYPPTNIVCGGYNEGARVLTRFLPMGIFPDALGQLTPQSLV